MAEHPQSLELHSDIFKTNCELWVVGGFGPKQTCEAEFFGDDLVLRSDRMLEVEILSLSLKLDFWQRFEWAIP